MGWQPSGWFTQLFSSRPRIDCSRLVATLGSRSNLKKVTRKAILDVDVPKACETITDSAAPMALRLQGSLLYGTARVYSQQCGYVLADVTSFRDKMRGITHILKEMETDPDIGKTRPEQLNLANDPAFIPELDMNIDLSIFDIETDISRSSGTSILSPHTLNSSQSSLPVEQETNPGPILPALDTPAEFDDFDFFGLPESSAVQTESRLGRGVEHEELGLEEEPDFEIDADGNIHSLVPVSGPAKEADQASIRDRNVTPSESGISARVRAEHEAGVINQNVGENFVFDDAPIVFGDEDPILPPAAPFSPRPVPINENSAPMVSKSPSGHATEATTTMTSTVEAPLRRQPQAKALVADRKPELHNKQLSEWTTNYVANMSEATKIKDLHKSLAQARKNAAFWILDQGIGGVQVNFGDDQIPHPLAIFSGQALLDALTGRKTSPPAGSKRGRNSSEGEDGSDHENENGDERRVRSREDNDEQVVRGEDDFVLGITDDDGILLQGDDYIVESEMGRHAPPSLQEHSSAMPWNISASRHGSSQRYGSVPFRISSSAGGIELGPPSVLSRRHSRLTSASPLHGKGIMVSDLAGIGSPKLPSDGLELEDDEFHLGQAMDTDEFEMYGPSAAVDTQTAAQSQWIAATLEKEAQNFLGFLQTQLAERGSTEEAGEEEEEEAVKSITMHELLPPAENTKVVAAQALLHVLALTTKGLIDVRQDEAFGDIHISLSDKGVVTS